MKSKSDFATVDADCQLLVTSGRHEVSWLKDCAERSCVCEIVQRGLVRVWPLDEWASSEGLSPEQGEEILGDAGAEPHEVGSRAGGHFLVAAKRKKRAGRPLHEIQLPAMAIMALFDQGTGPMTVRKGGGSDSGRVEFVACGKFFELRGQPLL